MRDFRTSTVYQIYPKSFLDTNGDGLGELRGVTAKLDYLKELGVDYLWLTPFFVSPQNDNGYDVADYRQIDPRYGTMDDFEELSREAEKRGLGLMLDMVFNHTSTEHEWFRKALAGDPKYKDYYIWRKGKPNGEPPTNWESKFGGNAWEYVPQFDEYYLHLFDKTQADLNWDNPEVRSEVADVVRFWMAKGVKGFRFDVINLISKGAFENDSQGDGRRFYTDGPRIHQYLRELNEATFGQDPGIITVGEMSSTSMENCFRYAGAESHELSMVFSFHHLKVDFMGNEKWVLVPADFHKLKDIPLLLAAGHGGARRLERRVLVQPTTSPGWSPVLGDEGAYWKQSAKMLANVIHCLRGTPYIYQGEEIGMTNAGFTDLSQYRDVESLNHFQILRDKGMSAQSAYNILNVTLPGQRPHPHAVGRLPQRRLYRRHALDRRQPQLYPHQRPGPGGRSRLHLYPLPDPGAPAEGVRRHRLRRFRGPGPRAIPAVLAYRRRWQGGYPLLHQQFLPQTLHLDLPGGPGGLSGSSVQLPGRQSFHGPGAAAL